MLEDRLFVSPKFTVRLHRGQTTRWKVEPFADYSLLFMLKGVAQAQHGESTYTVGPGSLLLFDPNTSGSATGKSVVFLTVSFTPSYLIDAAVRTRFAASGKLISFRSPSTSADERLERLMRDLSEEMANEDAGREELIAALLDQLTIYLLRHHTAVRRSDQLELSRVGVVDRRVRRAIELMHANLHRDLPLSEMAAAAYLSAFHFSRLFKKIMGTSPHAYLGTLRTDRARTLLAETDLSVTEVGSRVGYSSSSHFTKAFRESTGLSPRAFRNALITHRPQSPDTL
jgi:AraC-like DNA-binding protein